MNSLEDLKNIDIAVIGVYGWKNYMDFQYV